MKRGCIIKTSALGDVVQALMALRRVKERAPEVEIDWIVEKGSMGVLEGEKEIAEIISVELKGKNRVMSFPSRMRELREVVKNKEYDFILDLQGNIKSLFILMCMRAKKKIGYGWKTVPEKINLIARIL